MKLSQFLLPEFTQMRVTVSRDVPMSWAISLCVSATLMRIPSLVCSPSEDHSNNRYGVREPQRPNHFIGTLDILAEMLGGVEASIGMGLQEAVEVLAFYEKSSWQGWSVSAANS